ncbi:Histone-lysine N-methyltransferase SETMAR [Eumeta japonica]|uniref:Histone-lysine N-methyltransferase SETMAR n=1 Tax=Eumeta variegata TaxID=151549 RepID=A0A4C1TQA1_EUMVA|nr:Histone-lysine N-methyltransferase SETMAR [Eumeta japonica]
MSAESSNLSNIEHRAVIKYFVKKGKRPKKFLKTWYQFFRKLRQIRWSKMGSLISTRTRAVKMILAQSPCDVHAWYKMLTPLDKQRRLQTSKDFGVSRDNIDEICDRIVTMNETWVRQYDPNLNGVHAMDEKGERPKKFKVQKSASLMATMFRDSEGVLLIDYLPKGTTMNGQYYVNLLAQAREAVVQKRRGKLSRGVLFIQDNASVHTARVSRQALKDTGFSEIDHPPYSPDLAPSYYFLFSSLKKELRVRRFVDDNQMKMAVESHFDCKEKEYFLGGLKALYTRCEKCISLEGDYIEK